jgi:hypothetical protein
MGLLCRFCGLGVYERYAGSKGQALPNARSWFREIQRSAETDLRVLRCNHCGHVEWFDFRGIQDQKWWER